MTNQPGRWNRPETECIRMRMVFEWTVIRQFGLGAGRGLVSKTDLAGFDSLTARHISSGVGCWYPSVALNDAHVRSIRTA